MLLTPTRTASFLLLLLASCATRIALEEVYQEPEPTPVPADYMISVGDLLQVEFSRTAAPVPEYTIGLGDRLQVEVQRLPELTATTLVAPDGTITYHRVGTVPAAGLTLEELRASLEEALARVYPEPTVSVFLVDGDMRTERFVEMLLRNPNGATREVRVSPEGTISLPGIGSVAVADRSLHEAEETLNEKLRTGLPSLHVVLNTIEVTQRTFSVVGEVVKPGRFSFASSVTLLEALALAGWETPYADLRRVVLMSRVQGGDIEATVYDVAEALEHGNPLAMVRIRPRDTVWVVRTGVGNLNEAIDQYIRRNLPISVGASYRINQN